MRMGMGRDGHCSEEGTRLNGEKRKEEKDKLSMYWYTVSLQPSHPVPPQN